MIPKHWFLGNSAKEFLHFFNLNFLEKYIMSDKIIKEKFFSGWVIVVILFIFVLVGIIFGNKKEDPIYNEKPILERSYKDGQLIKSLRDEQNPLSVLQQHWGGRLKEKIRSNFQRTGRPLSDDAEIILIRKKTSQILTLEVKEGEITGMVNSGEVFVKISGDTNQNNGIYSLYCMNGLISKYSRVDENHIFEFVGQVTNQPQYIVPQGKGLIGPKISYAEAFATANALGIPLIKSKGSKVIALVKEGECFEKVPGQTAWKRCRE
ncbi:MAG: hypothetical protein QM532_01350 [Cyanobium sp. MAG06]|nr:hypothetical protein [Cyanobium sp. MAG06]